MKLCSKTLTKSRNWSEKVSRCILKKFWRQKRFSATDGCDKYHLWAIPPWKTLVLLDIAQIIPPPSVHAFWAFLSFLATTKCCIVWDWVKMIWFAKDRYWYHLGCLWWRNFPNTMFCISFWLLSIKKCKNPSEYQQRGLSAATAICCTSLIAKASARRSHKEFLRLGVSWLERPKETLSTRKTVSVFSGTFQRLRRARSERAGHVGQSSVIRAGCGLE